jgi:predicted DNA-binding transcriptional regulator AlpA
MLTSTEVEPTTERPGITDRYLNLAGVMEITPFSAPTIRSAERRGELPAYRVCGRLLFRLSDVLEWIEKGRTAPRRVPPPELLAAAGRPRGRRRR